jgi:thiosulfate/3-mercaptopyruvate sulfurtransferase
MFALPSLIDATTLTARLDDPAVLILDATVVLDRPPQGGPYTPVSGRAAYEREHLPGAGFADLIDELADPSAPFPFALPAPQRFTANAGRLGIGEGVHVVAYAQDSPMWATRLWWLLRYFGFDDVSVLDGGLPAWRAARLPLTGAPAPPRAPQTFTARPRPELLAR